MDFLVPDAFSVNLDIDGVGFNVSHGDDVRGSLGIPYYGLQRQRAQRAKAVQNRLGCFARRVRRQLCPNESLGT